MTFAQQEPSANAPWPSTTVSIAMKLFLRCLLCLLHCNGCVRPDYETPSAAPPLNEVKQPPQRFRRTSPWPRTRSASGTTRTPRAAARFYAATLSRQRRRRRPPRPRRLSLRQEGDVLTVDFTVAGIPCIGLNGGPIFKQTEAFSFQIATDDQAETDRYWNAIVGNGGQESDCGWCKDKWGVNWQITPRVLTEAMAAGGDEAKRAFDAMMTMKKIDVAAIEAARRG